MTFDAQIVNDWIGVRFYLKVSGIDAIFLDGPIPIGPTGEAWAAPASGAHSYVYKENMLDLSGGLSDIGQSILRRAAHTSPGQMTLTLADNRLNYLLDLFGRDNPDNNQAVIDSALDYDTDGTGSVIECKSGNLSDWDASGYAWIGRECVYYPVINGDDLGQTGNKCTRDLFSVGDCDIKFTKNSNKSQAPRMITDHPTVWHNRAVQLFAYLVDREGRALDSATGMSHEREIFRGVIQGTAAPDSDSWTKFNLNCRSIDSLLHSDVGKEALAAELLRVVGKVDANGNAFDLNGEADVITSYYISESTNTFDVTLVKQSTGYTKHFSVEMLTAGDVYSIADIHDAFESTLTDAVQLDATFNNVSFHLKKKLSGSAASESQKGAWQIWCVLDNPPAAAIDVVMHFAAPGSIGKVLGFFEDQTWLGFTYYANSSAAKVSRIAAWIGAGDESIPFYYPANLGLVADTPAEPGFVKLGDEVIKYTSITDQSAKAEGLHTLNDCVRGMLGTAAVDHLIEYDDQGQALADKEQMKFIQAFEDESFFDVILQLATSTGAGHHGDFDELGHAVGPAISPAHFDLDQIASVKSQLADWEHRINWYFEKPQKLMDLMRKWLQPLGMFVTAATNDDGDFKITIGETLPPLQAEAFHTFDSSNVLAENPANWKQGADLIINEISAKWQWSVSEGKFRDGAVACVRDLDSISDYGVKGRMSWELLGFSWHWSKVIQNLSAWGYRTFARYGKPYDLVELELDRKAWLLRAGDTILVSLDAAPTTEATHGFEQRAARVLSISNRYHQPSGVPGAKVLIALENVLRHSSYSPSAEVSAVSTTTITLNANSFTSANVSTDVDHFDVGDRVKFFNRGDVTVYDIRTISSIDAAAHQVVIDSALTNVTYAAGETHMIASTYDDPSIADSQQDHVFVSTLSTDNTTPFKYV